IRLDVAGLVHLAGLAEDAECLFSRDDTHQQHSVFHHHFRDDVAHPASVSSHSVPVSEVNVSVSIRSHMLREGQAMVEFALVLPVSMIVLCLAIQFALIGRDALALGQMNYQAARWTTSQNPSAQCSDIASYMSSVAAPSIQAIISKYGISCDGSTP